VAIDSADPGFIVILRRLPFATGIMS